jgi:ribosome-binding protein aMBF1 (putative translation factor)
MATDWIANDTLEDRLREIAVNHPTWQHHLAVVQLWSDITDAMKQQGITQSELAERAGLKQSYVSRLLSSPERITLRAASRLCHALGLELVVKAKPKAAARKQPAAKRPAAVPRAKPRSRKAVAASA